MTMLRSGARSVLLAAALLAACGGRQLAAPPVAAPAPVRAGAIYEVFVRDFSPAGDLRGVVANVDRIRQTGADVVWLMPIHPIGVLNRKAPLGSSYAVRDYRAINPDYGNAADLRALVNAVHAAGMKLIIDWVPNHTAWDHVWVREHPEFYLRDARGGLTVPRDNEGKLTDWTDVADLDYSKPGLRREMIASMRYWLDEYGIDGFRVDVAGMVPDDFWREAIPQLRAGRSVLLLAEWGDAKMHELGFDLTYGWDGYHKLKAVWKGEPASGFIERELQERNATPAVRRLRFTTNHDETAWDSPPVTLFGGSAGARAAYVAMAMLPGTPLLYNGQEVESAQKLGLFEKQTVEWEQPGADSARAFYGRVIELARRVQDADLRPLQTDAATDVIAYARGNVIVLVNARSSPVRFSVQGVAVQGMRELVSGRTMTGSGIELPAHGFLVLEPAGR